MSLDRARQRDMGAWNRKGFRDFSSDNCYIDNEPSGLYTDFTEQWPDPRQSVSYTDRSNYRWQHNRPQWCWNDNEGDSYGGQQRDLRHGSLPENLSQVWGPGMQDWQDDGQWARPGRNFRGRPMPPHGQLVDGQRQSTHRQHGEGKNGNNTNNHWNNLTKQFGNTSFHRQDMNDSIEGEFNISSSSSLRGAKSDSSGLEDSISSGGGKKRPRSLEREGNLPKSSRAENPRSRSSASVLLNSSRALSLSDLTEKETRKQRPQNLKHNKGQGVVPRSVALAGPASQQAGLSGKKKQVGSKTKATPGLASKTTTRSDEQQEETSGEGVLERAERMCQELREKRQQVTHARAGASCGQRVAALRNALNTSVRHFNSAHKSFLKGCKSDNGSVSSVASSTKAGGTPHLISPMGSAVGGSSTAQKKHFSSSTSSVESVKVTRPKSASSFTAHPQDSHTRSTASTASSSSSQVVDIERIRHSIESSVRAEERTRPAVRGHSASASLSSPASSAVHAMVRRKPPLPLSKDALAKMVSAPRSRTQRLQLARMLRHHSSTLSTTAARPRRVHLDGLYDNTDEDGDSIEDVLKNISGLEEIGDCAELKNIKLEDLTNEDKLRIAQLIEDVDISDRDRQLGGSEPGDRAACAPMVMRSDSTPLVVCSDSSDREADMSIVIEQSAAQLRRKAMSPVPSRPLSMDDLNTERIQQTSSARRSPSLMRSVLMSSLSPVPSSVRSPSPVNVARNSQDNSAEKGAAPVEDTPMESIDDHHVADSGLEPVRGTDYRSPSPVKSPVAVPMEISQDRVPGNHSFSENSALPRSLGVMHEVMSLCQQQDIVGAEMKDIDVELSQMYKSLIEIVARMSGLQRRRVQLQSEGEQLSHQRNHLLTGLVPEASMSAASGSRTASERRPHIPSTAATFIQNGHSGSESGGHKESAMESPQGRPPIGSSVTLPKWLSAPSSSRQQIVERRTWNQSRAELVPSAGEKTPDACQSGNVTPKALSRTSSFRSSVDSAHDTEDHTSSADLHSRPSSAGCVSYSGRPMLSIHGVIEKDKPSNDSGEKETAKPSLSEISAARNSVVAESSSGLGSSISTQANSGQPPDPTSSDHPSLHDSGLTLTSAASSQSKQPASEGRLIFNSFTSPQPSRPGGSQSGDVVKSPGVGIAYLGSLSSDLVQQIVRNLPITSQLGEAANRPSMFMLKPGNSAGGDGNSSSPKAAADTEASARRRATSIDSDMPATAKSRMRTTSLHSVYSHELSSGEENLAASVPPLKLSEASDKGGSTKSCNETPRSESDAYSCTSGTSLGEQIKLFSERNTSSLGSLSFHGTSFEDGLSIEDMASCSVILDRIDLVKREGVSPSFKIEDDDADRPRKRKTKKDRNLSLHRRKQFAVNSSSEGEEVSEEEAGGGSGRRNSLPDIVSGPQQHGLQIEEDDHLSDFDSGEVDRTLVDAEQLLPYTTEYQEGGSSSSRLKLNPEKLKNFRELVQRNMTSSPFESFDSSTSSTGKEKFKPEVKKDSLKILGTCTPVMGLEVHGSSLYIGYLGGGVNSYSLTGQITGEYAVPSAQCFTVTPAVSGSQHLVTVGGQDQLIFLSTADQSVVEDMETTAKVKCLLVVDTTLYAGMDSGTIVVVNLTTLKEVNCFQASDRAIHCMTWTREGSTRLLCIASEDSRIHVIDAGSGLPVRIIGGHTKTAFTLFMLDQFVLSGSGDRKVMAHNVHTAAFVWELHDHKGIITSLCVDNGLLFTAGYDKIIRCYDLKSRKLLHLLYGAGKSIIMKMIIHNSILYTGNRDGQVEAIDLRNVGSFTCECAGCGLVLGLKEHLWHHLVSDHLLPNAQAMRCPWSDCSVMLDTGSALVKANEHIRSHIVGS